jgi:hydrogenase maturation protease
MSSGTNKALLLGMGSEVLCDAGIGPKLAKEVLAEIGPGDIDLALSTVGGLDLLHIIYPYKKVVIIDGILRKNKPPGKINIHHYPDCPDSLHLSNGHDADFSLLKEMAEISGIPFPEEIIMITVSVKDPFTVSDELSEELKGKFEGILKKTHEILRISFAP